MNRRQSSTRLPATDVPHTRGGSEDRDAALKHIKEALSRIHDNLIKAIPGLSIHKSFDDKSDALRLVVSKAGVQIKIELSPVLRGTVYEPKVLEVGEKVEDVFGYVAVPVVSLADLYGGKICAALDRQHPRDLFDVKLLLENEGLTEEVRKATLVYIISHPRPIPGFCQRSCTERLKPRIRRSYCLASWCLYRRIHRF